NMSNLQAILHQSPPVDQGMPQPYTVDVQTIPPFAAKLYESMDKAEFANCVKWDPSGTMIHITDCKEFTKNVLPVYFKTRMFNSFVRQLHIYGFTRKSDARKNRGDNSKNQCTFQHPFFQKGRRDLLHNIKRQPQKNTKDRYNMHYPYPYHPYGPGYSASPQPAPYHGGYYNHTPEYAAPQLQPQPQTQPQAQVQPAATATTGSPNSYPTADPHANYNYGYGYGYGAEDPNQYYGQEYYGTDSESYYNDDGANAYATNAANSGYGGSYPGYSGYDEAAYSAYSNYPSHHSTPNPNTYTSVYGSQLPPSPNSNAGPEDGSKDMSNANGSNYYAAAGPTVIPGSYYATNANGYSPSGNTDAGNHAKSHLPKPTPNASATAAPTSVPAAGMLTPYERPSPASDYEAEYGRYPSSQSAHPYYALSATQSVHSQQDVPAIPPPTNEATAGAITDSASATQNANPMPPAPTDPFPVNIVNSQLVAGLVGGNQPIVYSFVHHKPS
ncbi:hypothetical protein H4R35_005449, partial [Dimargaris xerosporica]